jgi:hypothetical protein
MGWSIIYFSVLFGCSGLNNHPLLMIGQYGSTFLPLYANDIDTDMEGERGVTGQDENLSLSFCWS